MSGPPTKIILAADAVVFLPIHGLTEWQPRNNGKSWNKQFEIIRDPGFGVSSSKVNAEGDKGCIQRIIYERRQGHFAVGVCDPLEILRSGKQEELCIIGGLINRPCFWLAVDSHGGASYPSLDVTEFCQHGSNLLTSNMWANRIADEIASNRHYPSPIPRTTGSFDDVVDGAVNLKYQKKASQIAVLTPCVLSIAILKHIHGADWNIHKIFDDPRFEKATTTAFVVHRDALLPSNSDAHQNIAYFMSQVIAMTNFFRNSPTEMTRMIERICKDPHRFKGERQIDSAYKVENGKIYSALRNVDKSGYLIPDSKFIGDKIARRAVNLLYGSDGRDIFSSACEVKSEEWSNALAIYKSTLTSSDIKLNVLYDETILKISHDMVLSNTLYGHGAKVFSSNKRLQEERSYFATITLMLPIIYIVIIYYFYPDNPDQNWKKLALALSSMALGVFAFFGLLRVPKKILDVVSKNTINKIMVLGWFLIAALSVWGAFYVFRFVIYEAPDNYGQADFKSAFLEYKHSHKINHAITSLGGILDYPPVRIMRDDLYGVWTVAVSVWISLTLGHEGFKLFLRKVWLKFLNLNWVETIRQRYRGGQP